MNRYQPAEDVIATDLGDELILLDPGSDEMYGLNETGRLVWIALPSSSVERIAAALATRFDVTTDRARDDVQSLLEALEQAGLIESQDDDGAG